MSFQLGAEEVRLEGTLLKAMLPDVEGLLVPAEIDLETILGNDSGSFKWLSKGFASSAKDITFSINDDGDPILRAKLLDGEGEYVDAEVDLSERIENGAGLFFINRWEGA